MTTTEEIGLAAWLEAQNLGDGQQVSIAMATVAMILNSLGWSLRQWSVVPQSFANKPVEHVLGAGISAEMLNDRPKLSSLALPQRSRKVLSAQTRAERAHENTVSREEVSSNSSLQGCNCGWYGDPVKECRCSATAIARYQKRISGPLLDRIDIHVEVPRVDYEKLAEKRVVEDSMTVRARVQAARERQLLRFKGTKLTCNAEMGPSEVREFCIVEPSAEKLLKAAMQQLHLSARAFHRVLKLARTIADVAECDVIGASHVAEAIQYRPRVGM